MTERLRKMGLITASSLVVEGLVGIFLQIGHESDWQAGVYVALVAGGMIAYHWYDNKFENWRV